MHWLDRYASNYHAWHAHDATSSRDSTSSLTTSYYRRIGIVEGFFDTDGREFEGRADLYALVTVNVDRQLPRSDRRRRILHAWAVLRAKHLLLSSRALSGHELPEPLKSAGTGFGDDERFFQVDRCQDDDIILQQAQESITFVEDHYKHVDPLHFHRHLMNSARTLDPRRHLAHMYVLPASSPGQLHCIIAAAHQIADGLSITLSSASFAHLLNLSEAGLRSQWHALMQPQAFASRLPAAQEDLYPQVHPQNKALRHWHWAIARILRHIHHTPARGFSNPLARPDGPIKSRMLPPSFDRILNYDPERRPPLNSFFNRVTLPRAAEARLRNLCREVDASIGAGVFALVGMGMMALRERFPLPKDADHSLDGLPFVGSFPINARPFFGHTGLPDSLMLAFSDGITLPFLSSSLGTAASRFRLLARQANRQLSRYQKGARAGRNTRALGAKSSAQLIPGNYIFNVERAESKLSDDARQVRYDAGWRFPQGDLPARGRNGLATCGVSSIGDRTRLIATLDKEAVDETLFSQEEPRWTAELADLCTAVRARDGEFLVGAAGDARGLHLGVSYDGSTLDEDKLGVWREVVCGLLDDDHSGAH